MSQVQFQHCFVTRLNGNLTGGGSCSSNKRSAYVSSQCGFEGLSGYINSLDNSAAEMGGTTRHCSLKN